MALCIDVQLLASIEESAVASSPEECCGMIIGGVEGRDHVADCVCATENVATGDRMCSYEIDPQAAFDAFRDVERTGQCVVGFYHSHPDGSLEPSAHDLRTAWPGKSYLIVGVDGFRVTGVRSWRLSDDGRSMIEETVSLTRDQGAR